jgi:hypothetical protein
LHLALDLLDLLFQEATDGLAIFDTFAWDARLAPRRIPPDPTRFAHLGPFARHLGVEMVGQLLALDEAETAASLALWRRVLVRLRPSRRPAFIARLRGWPDDLRRRVEPVIVSWGVEPRSAPCPFYEFGATASNSVLTHLR